MVIVDIYVSIPTKPAILTVAPATANTHEQQIIRLARKLKLLRARDVAQQGLPTIALTRLVQAGKLERVARGLYSLPGAATSEHRSLAEVAARVPKGVICLLSALRFHEIGTQAPFEVWIAIPNRGAAPRIDQPAIRVVRMSDAALAESLQRSRIDGVNVPREMAWLSMGRRPSQWTSVFVEARQSVRSGDRS